MLIHLLKNAAPADRERLKEFFALPYSQRSRENVRWILRLMEHYGSVDFSKSFARRFAGAALFELSKAFAGATGSEDYQFIESLVLYALDREI